MWIAEGKERTAIVERKWMSMQEKEKTNQPLLYIGMDYSTLYLRKRKNYVV